MEESKFLHRQALVLEKYTLHVIQLIMFLEAVQTFDTDSEFVGSVAPHQGAGSTLPLLTWKVAQKKLPWGIVLLLGGGFALAKGSEVSDSHNVNGKLSSELPQYAYRLK